MTGPSTTFPTAWKKLKRLGALPIEIERVDLVRSCDLEALRDPARMVSLIADLGLNDEGLDEIPSRLHGHCGQGLRIWQLPFQFGPYLVALTGLGITSYLELGVRHGGSFVATVEVLRRFHPLGRAVAVDLIPCPSLDRYREWAPESEFVQLNTRSPEFSRFLDTAGRFDLVLIDSFHQEEQLRTEFLAIRDHANAVAFHDIVSTTYPGVGVVWKEVLADDTWHCREFVDQEPGGGPPRMGLGLAVRKERDTSTDGPASG